MKTTIKYVGLVLSLFMVANTYAYHDLNAKSGGKGKDKGDDGFVNKANCPPATARLIFEFNDVRAQLNTNGVLFYDRAGRVAAYEVPKTESGPKLKAIFAAALWMGGTDVNGQLKLAAAKFGDGNDFWTGPLTVTPGTGNMPGPGQPVGDDAFRDFGEANIDPAVCIQYNKYFTIRKAEVIAYSTWWESTQPGYEGEEVEKPNAEILARIYNWPAHGDVDLGQDYYLAPFYDRAPAPGQQGDGIYQPVEQGDYPWYDDILGRDDIACGSDRRISLFGDETHWWVFNDKGNIHTESTGDPIGMEIRAQAFAFTTNDEVNKMTFYNYEMINRGTQTLFNTYFAQYVDADLGGAFDDYVGCDVSRGLGYAFNGDNFDGDFEGNAGYGNNPPAIGVDFFEGPYQDADGLDNYGPYNDTVNGVLTPAVMNVQDAINGKGIVYKGLGIGYKDGIVDNERFGMKRFCYYTNGASAQQSDPTTAAQFYNYMSGKWRFGDDVIFGGTGFEGSPGSISGLHADYVFPSDSDPLHWSTGGTQTSFPWAENNTDGNGGSNPPGDRRFVQAAGPFTLKPGAINNITVGIVYARSTEGDLFASVRALRRADTKAQALFDNCFEILDPPNAPVLKIQELNNELILMLDNPIQSNNKNESYAVEDKINIIDPGNGTIYDKFYRFEGYQIYQMKDATTSVSDLEDIDKARLVAQCDIVNDVSRIVNFEFDEELGLSIPNERVKGENKGIRHTFQVKEDLFAQGVRTLVNHKKYYYIAVAYAFNQFKKYDPDDPTALDGQKIPYIASRINADGTAIIAKEAIPHNPVVEAGGTVQSISYGSSPQITRLDGIGNGNRALEFTASSLTEILTTGYKQDPTYEYGAGPLNVKVVDPLNLVGGYFECVFKDYVNPGNEQHINYKGTDTASWVINHYDKKGGELIDFVTSERTIKFQNEQIIPKWGISVEITQNQYYKGTDPNGTQPPQSLEYDRFTPPIESTINFKDSSKRWLSFVNDNDSYFPTNWILSGVYAAVGADTVTQDPAYLTPKLYNDELGRDPNQAYEKILSGGIAPHSVVGYKAEFSPLYYPTGNGANFLNAGTISQIRTRSSISRAPSITIVLTADKSKWTRCAVIELGRNPALNVGQAIPGSLRKSASVDQNGNAIAGTGMGWFPGYAIDMESGMRLHMAFGENSFLGSDNGGDMIWNPSSRLVDNNGRPVIGGQQPIYVFGYNINGEGCPYYDGVNNWVYDKLATATGASYREAYMSLTWVANTLLTEGQDLLSTDVTMRVRINKEYSEFTATGKNGGKPMYSWSMDDIRTVTGSSDVLAESLSLINVVPNPYYAFSTYETTRLDTRVKITNLPDQCIIKIYNVSGKLIRTFKKDSPVTSIDWDMKNNKGIPIASGVYLIHVEVEGVGETIIKFFGGVRQPDLENI
ncbi:MAG: T9SS type A sorting domain-containing protein [Crocinitomicaceae bacterium]|nr:MAG: T9SS type A sorting domain-containing protein [Crocinitomicaceae bacterium]